MRGRHRTALRVTLAVMLVIVGGLAAAGCGSGDGGAAAAPSVDVLTPSTQSGGKRDSSASPVATPTSTSTSRTSPSATPKASPTSTPKPPTDTAIKRGILARLSSEPGLRGFTFKVVVRSGTVTIVGRVRTKDQKRLAEQICLTEPGVVKVLSAIEVSASSGY